MVSIRYAIRFIVVASLMVIGMFIITYPLMHPDIFSSCPISFWVYMPFYYVGMAVLLVIGIMLTQEDD